MARTARQDGLNRLYHYQDFNAEYLRDILTNRRLYCSDPAKLNDPWDCRPWFSHSALDEPPVIEEFIEWVFSSKPTSPVSDEQAAATKSAIRNLPEYRHGLLASFSNNFLEMIPSRWKIYSLTPHPDSTLMWSHYGGDHRGICLEFDVGDDVIGSAQPVRYLSSYPSWTPQSLAENGIEILLTKSSDWQYEHEYRVIALAEGVERQVKEHPLLLKGSYLGITNASLRSIIAGCEADFDLTKCVVEKCSPETPIRRAVRAVDKFKLEVGS
jgi:hypothetical protein